MPTQNHLTHTDPEKSLDPNVQSFICTVCTIYVPYIIQTVHGCRCSCTVCTLIKNVINVNLHIIYI